MVIQWKKLLICIAVPLGVGGLSALLTAGNMQAFEQVKKPPLSPPGWVFPVVWTILYILMGIALYIVITHKERKRVKLPIVSFGVQLFFNFFWSIIFFNARAYLVAFIWLILLWVAIAVNLVLFYGVDKKAGKLLIPYLAWVTFAGYLNLGIYILNP